MLSRKNKVVYTNHDNAHGVKLDIIFHKIGRHPCTVYPDRIKAMHLLLTKLKPRQRRIIAIGTGLALKIGVCSQLELVQCLKNIFFLKTIEDSRG